MFAEQWNAAVSRAAKLEEELRLAHAQPHDARRIADLQQQLAIARAELAALQRGQAQGFVGYAPAAHHYMFPSRATSILVLGICSIVLCQLLGPIAWVMGNEELRRIDAGQTPLNDRSSAQAGQVCGIIGTVFALALIGLFILVMMYASVHHSGAR